MRQSAGACQVAIVGAGVAGLAAARGLAAAGISHVLLEARGHAGGRAETLYPAALGGAPFDRGAQWFHDAHRNPLLDLARAQGIETRLDDSQGVSVVVGADGPGCAAGGAADGAAAAAYARSYDAWQAAMARCAAGPDMSLRAAGDAAGADLAGAADPAWLRADPWRATIEAWEAEVICAAPASALSLHDWCANRLLGRNAVSPAGLGAAVARITAAEAARAVYAAPVSRIDGNERSVAIHTPQGVLRAEMVILTVSIGVLQHGRIALTPGLPQASLAALDGLRMGQASKLALAATGNGRLGVAPGSDVFRQIAASGDQAVFTLMWPHDLGYVTGFGGGETAMHCDGLDEAAAAALLREEMAAAFGAQAACGFAARAVVSGWGRDANFFGAYAYCRPGHAAARAMLAEPVWDGRLVIAGEAVARDGLCGTVAGAWISGMHAAEKAVARFHPRGDSVYTVRP